MQKVLFLLFFLIGCTSTKELKTRAVVATSFVPDVKLTLPEFNVNHLINASSFTGEDFSRLNDRKNLRKLPVYNQHATKWIPQFNWCHVHTASYDFDHLRGLTHIPLKVVGEWEEWIPINGEPQRYLTFEMVE